MDKKNFWRDVIAGAAFLILCLALHIQKVQRQHALPPQPVPIQLDTWSLRTGDALDPAKRCDPPVLYEGRWYPMTCPIEGDFQ